MCGINGILRLDRRAKPVDRAELTRTRDFMRSRGPDGAGAWTSEDGTIGLGHRRLAIIDLSPTGAQPMDFDGGRYRIVFNGEIYNYRELRDELSREGVAFRSHSDTEVILALYARQGETMLPRLRGMYALALWDERERRLLLARGPYGIKPLYFAVRDGYLRFASQIKALDAGGAIPDAVDPAGLVGFLLWGSVPEPLTIRRGVRSIPSGHFVVVSDGEVGEPRALHRPSPAGSGDATDVAGALDDSVRAHLVADVPVGIFLSAGLDSGLIVSLARRHLDEPPTTLTVTFEGFKGTPEDEGPLAAETARALGTRHVERMILRKDLAELWPACLAAMDQPSIDGFNTYLVSRVARAAGLKVILSGLGGDELFGSYASFEQVPRWARAARRIGQIPALETIWPGTAGRLVPRKPKLSGFLRYGRSLAGAYFLRHALFLPDDLPVLIGKECAEEGLAAYDPIRDVERVLAQRFGGDGRGQAGRGDSAWEAVHLMESSFFMRNQLLRDCDWASMAHSLELRVPLVDARLQQAIAAARFEPARSRGKSALVRQVAPDLPPAVFHRRKSGFGIPLATWMSGGESERFTMGGSSRFLALRVLEAFGIEHRRPAPSKAALLAVRG